MQPPGDRLALLYRVSQAFNSSLELDQVLNSVMDEVIAATRAERGFIVLRDGQDGLAFRAARGIDQQTLDAPEFQVSRGVVERVISEGRPLLASNAQTDDWLAKRATIITLGLRSILCVPLQLKTAILGVIYVDNRLQAGVFSQGDLDLLAAIASSAAIDIENARLYAVAVEKGRMERELQVAHDLQASLLPRSMPVISGWDIAAMWLPAREVAGDFYDFVTAGRRLGIVIGDVCDKGMPAALFMALSRTILRASLGHGAAAQGMEKANRLICADATNGMFVTVCYGQIDTAGGDLLCVNAGHNRPLVYQSASDNMHALERRGMALGIEPSLRFAPMQAQEHAQLEAGDFVLFYTDGVTDAVSGQGEQFGAGRLREALFANRHASAASIMNALQQALRNFIGPAPQFDDITAVLVKRTMDA